MDPSPSDEHVTEVIDAVREVGGLEDAREVARDYAASARDRLASLPDDPAVETLRLTVEFVLERQK
jgi:geranylgeranyl pyrophosphate synthase